MNAWISFADGQSPPACCGESTTNGRSSGHWFALISLGGPFASTSSSCVVPFPFSPMPCQNTSNGFSVPSPYPGGSYS
jgi:hypothetical protein